MQSEETFGYINEVRFKTLNNWSVAAFLSGKSVYKDNYALVPIGNLLIRNKEKEEIQDDKFYKQVTVKLYGKGVVQRGDELVAGNDIGTKTQYRISEGQFIMSKIDARNGAFGIVPSELDGAITTQDFLSFNINVEKILPQFFVLITGTNHFAELCQRASSGTTGRQRVNENAFLSFLIPVPNMQTQSRLVGSYYKKVKRVEEIEEKVNRFSVKIENLLCNELGIRRNNELSIKEKFRIIRYKHISRWSTNFLNRKQTYSYESAKFPLKPLKSLLNFFEGGSTPSKSRKDFWTNGKISWISPKDMKSLYIKDTVDKISESAVEQSGLRIYPPNTIVAVFRSGILKHSFPVAISAIPFTINQDMKAMDPNEELDRTFLVYYLRTFQKSVLELASKSGVTVESVNSNEFLEFKIVLPPKIIQKTISREINNFIAEQESLIAEANSLKKLASQEFESEIFN